jgi:anhydro-N-acetylmuramic acid kinase
VSADVFIGVMSGTSLDGVDVAAVRFHEDNLEVLGTYFTPYNADLIQALHATNQLSIPQMMQLDTRLGEAYATAVNAALERWDLDSKAVCAIGLHGQTIDHHPHPPSPYTLQIGNASIVAEQTRCTTVADFRSMDIAAGGQGAPLVCGFHQQLFASADETRIVLNIGGIANITELVPGIPVRGYDTGPGNGLMDAWIGRHRSLLHDADGDWARSGVVIPALLDRMLADDYFACPPPKSTGREYFNLQWLEQYLQGEEDAPVDVQTTLAELTARTIADAVHAADRVIGCGGGLHNRYLIERIEQLSGKPVHTSTTLGVDPDYMEALAFAWLARQRLMHQPGNVPSVTGARHACVLGAVYS